MAAVHGFLGASPISTSGGLLGALGLALLLLGLVFDKDDLVKAGMAMVGTAATIIGLAARDNSASEKAHQESLDGIADAEAKARHGDAQVAQAVPHVAAAAAKQAVVEELNR